MLNVSRNKIIILACFVFVVLQTTYGVSKLFSINKAKQDLSVLIENRIAKDLIRLPLPDVTKSSAGNALAIKQYINTFNENTIGQIFIPDNHTTLDIRNNMFYFWNCG